MRVPVFVNLYNGCQKTHGFCVYQRRFCRNATSNAFSRRDTETCVIPSSFAVFACVISQK